MSNEEILRRSSYGPNSPVVGERGARTRQHIVDVTLRLFEEKGFHNTSVDDIAKAADISRATLYQYFKSKEQLFVELLDKCGAAMLRVVRRLGPLAPTAEGFDNLHWWLGEWAWVYDKYATMFAQWIAVDSSKTGVKPLVTGFVDAYVDKVSARLESSGAGAGGPDTRHLAAALLLVVHRFNYLRHTSATVGLGDDDLIDALAVAVQLVLFPGTPPEAFAAVGPGAGRDHGSSRFPPAPQPSDARTRFDSLSPRARRTVQQLLDAAARVFALRGFDASNVDDVVTEAGVARGTFYKYFADKVDLLGVLALQARDELVPRMEELGSIRPGPGHAAELRDWVRRFLPVQRRYNGVARVWIDQRPEDPAVLGPGHAVGEATDRAIHAALADVERPFKLGGDIAVLLLSSVLERLPDGLGERGIDDDELVEIIAVFLERGVLGGKPVRKTRTSTGGGKGTAATAGKADRTGKATKAGVPRGTA